MDKDLQKAQFILKVVNKFLKSKDSMVNNFNLFENQPQKNQKYKGKLKQKFITPICQGASNLEKAIIQRKKSLASLQQKNQKIPEKIQNKQPEKSLKISQQQKKQPENINRNQSQKSENSIPMQIQNNSSESQGISTQRNNQYYTCKLQAQNIVSNCQRFSRKRTYKLQSSTPQFNNIYLRHLVKAINHINSSYQYLAKYKILTDIPNTSTQLQYIRVEVQSADSTFDFKKNFDDQYKLLQSLNEDEALNWIYSFAQILIELEKKHIYHLDLNLRNTVKLNIKFQCIDFEYIIYIYDEESVKKLIQLWIYQETLTNTLFKRIFNNDDNFFKQYSIKLINYLLQKLKNIKKAIDNLKKDINASKYTYAQKEGQIFKQFKLYLAYNHKLDFLLTLNTFIQFGQKIQKVKNLASSIKIIIGQLSLLKTSNQQQIHTQQVSPPGIKNQQQNIYKQFLKYLQIINRNKFNNPKIKLPLTCKLVLQNNLIQQALDNHLNILKFLQSSRGEFYQRLKNPQQLNGQISCEILNTCRQFKDIFQLKRGRYLCYFLKSAFESLRQLSRKGIYFYALNVQDFVIEGEVFKIRKFSRALKLYKQKSQKQIHEQEAIECSIKLLNGIKKVKSDLINYQHNLKSRSEQQQMKEANMRFILQSLVQQLIQSFLNNCKEIIKEILFHDEKLGNKKPDNYQHIKKQQGECHYQYCKKLKNIVQFFKAQNFLKKNPLQKKKEIDILKSKRQSFFPNFKKFLKKEAIQINYSQKQKYSSLKAIKQIELFILSMVNIIQIQQKLRNLSAHDKIEDILPKQISVIYQILKDKGNSQFSELN